MPLGISPLKQSSSTNGWPWQTARTTSISTMCCQCELHGSLNVPIEHHPTIRYMVYNGYYKVMSNIPKMGQLPTPELDWDTTPTIGNHRQFLLTDPVVSPNLAPPSLDFALRHLSCIRPLPIRRNNSNTRQSTKKTCTKLNKASIKYINIDPGKPAAEVSQT